MNGEFKLVFNNNQECNYIMADIDDDKKIIYEVHPMEIFLGKSKCCMMTAYSGAFDIECFVGNNKHRYVYIGGDMVCSFQLMMKYINTSLIWVVIYLLIVLQQVRKVYII